MTPVPPTPGTAPPCADDGVRVASGADGGGRGGAGTDPAADQGTPGAEGETRGAMAAGAGPTAEGSGADDGADDGADEVADDGADEVAGGATAGATPAGPTPTDPGPADPGPTADAAPPADPGPTADAAPPADPPPPGSPPTAPAPPPPPRRARTIAAGVGRGLVALLSLALLVGTGWGWSVYRQVDDRVVTSDVIATDPATPAPAADEPFTALLVGLDSRTDAAGNPLPPELLAQLRAGSDEGQLHTDTIILMHVPAGPDARAVAISIPRDSFVALADGGGTHKINSAYGRATREAEKDLAAQGVSGADLDRRGRDAGRRALVATVEDLTGVPVDHYAEINLAGFVEMTEAVGGVPVCLNRPVREVRSGVDLPAGPQTVRGADALAFVRQRRGLEDGDLDRIARQQAFLAGMASRVISAGTLSDPGAVRRLVDAVTRHVVLDSGWQLDRLVAQFGRMSGADIRFLTIPTGTPALDTPVDGIAVEVDADEVAAFARAAVAATDAAAAAGPSATAGPSAAGPNAAGPNAATGPGAAPTAPAAPAPVVTDTPAAPTVPGSGDAGISADGVTCVD